VRLWHHQGFRGSTCCRHYRNAHGLHASVWHPVQPRVASAARPISCRARLARAAVEIRGGTRSELTVGDLSAQVDWGYAPDYVRRDGAHRPVLPASDEFVVATGAAATRCAIFVAAAFQRRRIGMGTLTCAKNPTLYRESPPCLARRRCCKAPPHDRLGPRRFALRRWSRFS